VIHPPHRTATTAGRSRPELVSDEPVLVGAGR